MTTLHKAAIGGATLVAFVLLAAMVAGNDTTLRAIDVDRSVRDVAIALWAFLLPAWFTLEEAWFAPPADQPDEVAKFQRRQTKGRLTWTVVAGAVAIVIGTSADATGEGGSPESPPTEANAIE